MKKNIFISILLTFVFTSCSHNSDDNPATDTSSSILPKNITYNENGTIYTDIFTYNGNKIASINHNDGTTTVYTYTGNQITHVDDYTGTNLDNRETFTYNSNGKISTRTNLSFTATIPSSAGNKQLYVYNSDGTISYTSYYGTLVSQTTLNYTGKIYLTNGEVSKVEFAYSGSSTLNVRNYTYDDKNNPFKNVLGFAETTYVSYDPTGYIHNITSFENVNYASSNYVTTFTYNSNNFPTEAVHHYSSGTSTTQYVY